MTPTTRTAATRPQAGTSGLFAFSFILSHHMSDQVQRRDRPRRIGVVKAGGLRAPVAIDDDPPVTGRSPLPACRRSAGRRLPAHRSRGSGHRHPLRAHIQPARRMVQQEQPRAGVIVLFGQHHLLLVAVRQAFSRSQAGFSALIRKGPNRCLVAARIFGKSSSPARVIRRRFGRTTFSSIVIGSMMPSILRSRGT